MIRFYKPRIAKPNYEIINDYWGFKVANDMGGGAIYSRMVNGVPIETPTQYTHRDIVWVRWNGRNMEIVK